MFCSVLGANISTLQKLKGDVLRGYDYRLRPLRNQSLPLRVYLEYNIGAIVELAEVSEKLSIAGILYMTWVDELITWDPTHYDNIDIFSLPSDKVWHPTVAVVNAFEKIESLDNALLPVRYFYNGTAVYALGNIIDSKCPVDTSYYPWDTHTCPVYIGSTVYFPSEVELISSRNDTIRKNYLEHGQWELSQTLAYVGRTSEFSVFVLEFTVDRKPTFLIVNTILPILFMSGLNILVFLLPVESGERVSYAITVLLAIAVFLTMVGDSLPKVSTPMSVLSVYLLSVLILSAVICLSTIVNLHIYFKDDSIPVPRFLQAITVCCLCLKAKRSKWAKGYRISRPMQYPTINIIGDYREYEPNRNTRRWKVTWQEASIACDKICFILFSLILIFLTVLLLLTTAKGVDLVANDGRDVNAIAAKWAKTRS